MATSLNHFGKYTPHGCFDCQFEKKRKTKMKNVRFGHNFTHSMHTIHTTSTRTTHNISSPVYLNTVRSAATTIWASDTTKQFSTRVQWFANRFGRIFFCDATTAIRAGHLPPQAVGLSLPPACLFSSQAAGCLSVPPGSCRSLPPACPLSPSPSPGCRYVGRSVAPSSLPNAQYLADRKT